MDFLDENSFNLDFSAFWTKHKINIAKYSSKQKALPPVQGYSTKTANVQMIGNKLQIQDDPTKQGRNLNRDLLSLTNTSRSINEQSSGSSNFPSLTQVNVEEAADVNSRHFRRKMLALEMTPKTSPKIRAQPHSPNARAFGPSLGGIPGSPVKKKDFTMPKSMD